MVLVSKIIIGRSWEMIISQEEEVFPSWAVEEAQGWIQKWIPVFPREGTWVEKEYKVPSLIVRLDCTIVKEGTLGIYEIEERPAGLGIARAVNSQFASILEELRAEWPEFKVVVSPRRNGSGDDYLWIETCSYQKALKKNNLLLVRAEPWEKEFHLFSSRAVAPVISKGDKLYGVTLGWWKKVSPSDFKSLPWEKGFVLKPLAGSKCRDVEIFHPDNLKGSSTKTRIRRVLERNGRMYVQDFFLPLDKEVMGENYFMVYRFFFGFSPKKKTYRPLGGIWMARKNLRLHGASDAISGPLCF